MKKFTFFISTLALCTLAYAGGGGSKQHRDNTTLFPPPQPDASLATPPQSPTLTEPKFQALVGEKVELKWTAVETADNYHVQIAQDPNFKWLVKNEQNVAATSFAVDGLEKGKTYYWRVAAWKKGNLASTNKSAFNKSAFEVK